MSAHTINSRDGICDNSQPQAFRWVSSELWSQKVNGDEVPGYTEGLQSMEFKEHRNEDLACLNRKSERDGILVGERQHWERRYRRQ